MDNNTININGENYTLLQDTIENSLTDKEQEIVNELTETYISGSDVTMGEFLADEEVNGLTFEEAYHVYIALMKKANGDQFFEIKENEAIRY